MSAVTLYTVIGFLPYEGSEFDSVWSTEEAAEVRVGFLNVADEIGMEWGSEPVVLDAPSRRASATGGGPQAAASQPENRRPKDKP